MINLMRRPAWLKHGVNQHQSFILNGNIFTQRVLPPNGSWNIHLGHEENLLLSIESCLSNRDSCFRVYIFESPNQTQWYQHRDQTVQVNQLNLITLTTTLLFGSIHAATAISLLLLPFCSLHITPFEHRIAQNHVSCTNTRLCFPQAPWYTSEIHMKINTKTWGSIIPSI